MPWFGAVAGRELQQLVPMFENTLTFTVTFQAVQALMDNNVRVTAMLALALAALVFVLLATRDVLETTKLQFGPFKALLAYVISLSAQVTTQFLSNLIAVMLRTIFFEALPVWWVLLFSLFFLSMLWAAKQRILVI